jgi:hypothetical protein
MGIASLNPSYATTPAAPSSDGLSVEAGRVFSPRFYYAE